MALSIALLAVASAKVAIEVDALGAVNTLSRSAEKNTSAETSHARGNAQNVDALFFGVRTYRLANR